MRADCISSPFLKNKIVGGFKTPNLVKIFLKRSEKDEEIQKKLHQTVKKVTESIEDDFHFNTAIAAVMELLNDMTTYKQEVIDKNDVSTESRKIWKEVLDKVILLIAPFAPHIG